LNFPFFFAPCQPDNKSEERKEQRRGRRDEGEARREKSRKKTEAREAERLRKKK